MKNMQRKLRPEHSPVKRDEVEGSKGVVLSGVPQRGTQSKDGLGKKLSQRI